MFAEMIHTLFTNPVLALVVGVVAIIIAKLLKLSGKVIKFVICIVLAYVLINFIGAGGF